MFKYHKEGVYMLKTKVLNVIIWGLALLSFTACSPDFDEQPHYVVKVEDGNTIVLKDGLRVHLIGVEGNRLTEEFLKNRILYQNVRIVFDRSSITDVTPSTQEVWAYVLTENNQHLNAEILQDGLTNLRDEFLTDSLRSFSAYANQASFRTPDSIAEEEAGPVRNKKLVPNNVPSRPPKSFTNLADLVEYAEQCVFLILGRDEKGKTISQGTGFFVTSDGLAVSNYHVFDGSSDWMIRTQGGKRYRVQNIVDSSKTYDYIIFRIDTQQEGMIPHLRLSEKTPRKGSDVVVIGNPKGLENTITRGIISAIRDQGQPNAVIQIDAAISPGSSGSPVLNLDGEVVAVATYKAKNCENCNFAMNVNVLGLN
jgi:serine protease Do